MATDPDTERLVAKFCERLERVPPEHRRDVIACIETFLEAFRIPVDISWIYAEAEATTTPEDTLREAGISTKRQAAYQRRMSSLLAGRA
jgi:hypothetical protein